MIFKIGWALIGLMTAFLAGYCLGTIRADTEQAIAIKWWFGSGYATALRCDKAELDTNATIDCYIKSFDRDWEMWKARGN